MVEEGFSCCVSTNKTNKRTFAQIRPTAFMCYLSEAIQEQVQAVWFISNSSDPTKVWQDSIRFYTPHPKTCELLRPWNFYLNNYKCLWRPLKSSWRRYNTLQWPWVFDMFFKEWLRELKEHLICLSIKFRSFLIHPTCEEKCFCDETKWLNY